MVNLYFFLYAFLNFLKSSIRPNIIWAVISNDWNVISNDWKNISHF